MGEELIFVSYTIRDGLVTRPTLERLCSLLAPLGRAYIDLLHNVSSNPQLHVLRTLRNASSLIAIVSPKFLVSEWVRFELGVAAVRGIPIRTLSIDQLNKSPDHLAQDLIRRQPPNPRFHRTAGFAVCAVKR